ncbi:MAG TPA: family 16 glycoside hydrolase [Gemmatimonadaceae bacterium]|nr:family 16 glycoside hydrolase [Gemmatimonadaceae bacterium]
MTARSAWDFRDHPRRAATNGRKEGFMAGTLPRLAPTSVPNDFVEVQDTTFSIDVPGRYVCSTWDEAVNNGGVPFDVIVIGAGMVGAYCAEKIYRNSNLRVLVLDAGAFLVPEHVQNLARIGLNAAGAVRVVANQDDPGTRERVWGTPWRSRVPFPGLAYCIGGRSLYWGGWAPRLTTTDLEHWPPDVAAFLQSATKTADEYERTEMETGVYDRTDYIMGALYERLKEKSEGVVASGVASIDGVEDPPLAVQARPPASGLFSFDKYSSAPILADAIREAAGAPDWRRRLFLVPRAHVVRLHSSGDAVTRLEVYENGRQRFLDVAPSCAVVLASGTVEATRLALESFDTPLMGRNLMAHLRSNTVVRINRSALGPDLPGQLEAAALLVRGSMPTGRFHIQVTAAAVTGADSEATMFRMIPDIDLLDRMLASQDSDKIVITLRGIAEMQGNPDVLATKTTGAVPSWMDLSDQRDEFGLRRAWVNLVPTPDDLALWRAMDDATLAFAQKLADGSGNIEYFYNKQGSLNAPGASWHAEPPPPSSTFDRNDPANKVRDGVGTTHHEAGTLWMGATPDVSVTDTVGRFHHRRNAYVAGPALFPAIGSANPTLTALTLARRTASAITTTSLHLQPGFRVVGNGGLRGWRMAGLGNFMELGANIIESVDGVGLLWYADEEFDDFVLRMEWRASSVMDNSGVFIRFPALGASDPANDWKVAVNQGYEIQIDDRGFNPESGQYGDARHMTGAIYGIAAAVHLASKPVGEWNTFDIEARGQEISVRLNGTLVSQLTGDGSRPSRGHIGLQNHHPGSRVQFRNIQIEPLRVVSPAGALRGAREARVRRG